MHKIMSRGNHTEESLITFRVFVCVYVRVRVRESGFFIVNPTVHSTRNAQLVETYLCYLVISMEQM